MRAVIYTRVSEDRTVGGRSVAEQEQECRAVCQREGWTVTEVFTDNDRSASRYATKGRPAFESLQQHIDRAGCDVLVTWEASRSNRDLATYVQLRDLCRERGVLWSYAGRTFDLADDADQFGTGLDALLAEQESARTSKRVQRAMRANAAAGRPHSTIAFGYRRVYDVTTKQLLAVEIDQDEAAVLREAASRVLDGEALQAIAADFNARGLTSRRGKQWYPSYIGRLMLSPTYAGKRTHRGEVVGEAIWPPMFDETTWWRLRAILTDPGRHTARDHHVVKHLLGGVAKCGRCGAPCYVMKNRQGTLSYLCSAGAHVGRQLAHVDELVTHVLLADLGRPGNRAVLEDEPATATPAWAETAAKRARLDSFYDAAARGEITPAALARIESTLLAEIAAEDAKARRATLPPVLRALGDLDIAAEWDTLPIRTQRAVVRHYLEVTILPVGRGLRTFDPASVQITWR